MALYTHIHGAFTLNKKIIIVTSLILIIILITTLAIGILSKKQKSTIVEAKKTEFKLQDNEHMHIELDASGDQVPVPNGYVGSKATGENEINIGYVIYEGKEEVNDTNKDEAQKSRNQYVWIPVPDPSKMYGTDKNGKKWGKLYEFSSRTGTIYEEVTGTYPENWTEGNEIMQIFDKKKYREPDILPSDNFVHESDSKLKTLGMGAKTTHEFLKQLETEFNNMITSVEKYGGFYIGRYETGNISKYIPVIQKGNTDINDQTWYTMYKQCKKLKGENKNIETEIIWGSQWDRVLMWLIESGNKTKEQIAEDATSWGNYQNATFEYINISGSTAIKEANSETMIPTGSTEYTKANNIYDLAGNVSDWTMEADSTFLRVVRGGYYVLTYGEYGPPSDRDTSYSADTSDYLYGCRAMLYIK